MDTKDDLKKIRTQNGLTQDEMAGKLAVTRQAVSRWENGETVPNTETLKLPIHSCSMYRSTRCWAHRGSWCASAAACRWGMPSSATTRMRAPNEDYCKWCYADGRFVYQNMDELLEFLVGHMSNENFSPEQARSYFSELLPKLKHWK